MGRRADRNRDDLAAQYDAAEALLTSALEHAPVGRPVAGSNRADIRKIHEKLKQPGLDGESIARYTGALFFAIVALTGHRKAMDLIRGSNERLLPVRKEECHRLGNTAGELAVLCELALAGRRTDLKSAIIAYHDRRRGLLHKRSEGASSNPRDGPVASRTWRAQRAMPLQPVQAGVHQQALRLIPPPYERIPVPDRKDEVYRNIKDRVISYAFPQRQRILLAPLAEELGTSTHHVREALIRLASEGWVDQLANKGFLAIGLDATMLTDYSELNRYLLVSVLDQLLAGQPIRKDMLARLHSVLEKLTPFEGTSEALATLTGDSFAAIAALGGNRIAMRFVEECNEHLYFIRTLECQDIKAISMELAVLCEMAVGRHFSDLRQTIIEYHERRAALLSRQIRFLGAKTTPDHREKT